MKFKKLFFAASSIAVASGLFGTIATSCSCGGTTIDDKLKISLDDNGNFVKKFGDYTFDYKTAIKDALSRSTNWTQFKNAFAEEIILKWYEDRASSSKSDSSKNTTFRVNLDEWNTKINKDYDELVKSLKNKYGNSYKFYLQNQTLDPAGGTEAAYKKLKLIEKVKAEFTSKVFATNYFGRKTADATGDQAKYPHIFSKASTSINEDALKDPSVWKDLGFYARTNSSFYPDEKITPNYLAKNPDGDYATIQNYVFDRWFKTEKPFFSAAALFKYSNPKYVADSKLAEIYNGVKTGTKIPDNPNEAFPFFGGYALSDTSKGTLAYKAWFEKLEKDGFVTEYRNQAGNLVDNQTVTIPKEMTEDSQTLLLTYGSQMIGGTANTLYNPYANAAASLYLQMITGNTTSGVYAVPNTLTQDFVRTNLAKAGNGSADNFAILSNFMFNNQNVTGSEIKMPATITSYIDLTNLYPGFDAQGHYHCALFKANKDYPWLYSGKSTFDEDTIGVEYVTNTVQLDLGKVDAEKVQVASTVQPWVFELNEAGMHAQTIDGYRYVVNSVKAQGDDHLDSLTASKNVLKYRLMQKKCGYDNGTISGDVFGESGKLKTYFTENLADIVLEMAMSTDVAVNVFRPVETYSTVSGVDESKIFMKTICDNGDNNFNITNLKAYFNAIITYDSNKKWLDNYESANSKTIAYRSKQVENAKNTSKFRTVYDNGLLAPIVFTKNAAGLDAGKNVFTYNTSDVVMVDFNNLSASGFATIKQMQKSATTQPTIYSLENALKEIAKLDFVTTSAAVAVNTDNGFSPQIATAKKNDSNRFWYKSYMVDKMMYSFGSNKAAIANGIKISTYKQYATGLIGSSLIPDFYENDPLWRGAMSTYYQSKLLSSTNNYATYGSVSDQGTTFFTNLWNAYDKDFQYKQIIEGENNDEVLNRQIFFATIAYLMGKDLNFENFYKLLNAKIGDDESAFVGYLHKTSKNIFGDDVNKPTTDLASTVTTLGQDKYNPYYWTADVNNIFDNTKYTDGTSTPIYKDSKITSDTYWHVIDKTNFTTLAGFTGIQTKASNSLDASSGLKAAAFENISKCSDGSLVLNANKIDPAYIDTSSGASRLVENYGCWFNYAGTMDNSGEKAITFKDIVDPSGKKETITAAKFVIDAQGTLSPALKLAKKIAEFETIDELKSTAKALGNLYYGDSFFRQVGDNEIVFTSKEQLRYDMLDHLPFKDSKSEGMQYLKCFQRMTDIELHQAGSTAIAAKDHAFTDKDNTFKLVLTQINKADVNEKHFAPTWDKTNKKWIENKNACIDLEEFMYILCNMAMESSVQQLATSDAIKAVHGDDKLIIYDAQLYNLFDTTWIKDWKKKTLGA